MERALEGGKGGELNEEGREGGHWSKTCRRVDWVRRLFRIHRLPYSSL